MAQYVKPNAFGGYKSVPGGTSDPECTHVILTKEEYDELYDRIKEAETGARLAREQAEKDIEEATKQVDETIKQTKENADHLIEEIQTELDAKIEECENLEELNKNLLRISKERSNAERGLRPKKQHTGYAVVQSRQKEIRYRSGKSVLSAMCWETIIQTPYSVAFTEGQVKRQTNKELFRTPEADKPGDWLIGKIGVNAVKLTDYADLIQTTPAVRSFNYVFDRTLRITGKGYWEVVLLHTRALTAIPDEMRASGVGGKK